MGTRPLAVLTAFLVLIVGVLSAVGLWTTSELDPPASHFSALAMGVLMAALAVRILIVGFTGHALMAVLAARLLSEDQMGRDGGRSISPTPDGIPTPDEDDERF